MVAVRSAPEKPQRLSTAMRSRSAGLRWHAFLMRRAFLRRSAFACCLAASLLACLACIVCWVCCTEEEQAYSWRVLAEEGLAPLSSFIDREWESTLVGPICPLRLQTICSVVNELANKRMLDLGVETFIYKKKPDDAFSLPEPSFWMVLCWSSLFVRLASQVTGGLTTRR